MCGADRNGDIRDGDELFLFVESQGLPDERVHRYEHYRCIFKLADLDIYEKGIPKELI